MIIVENNQGCAGPFEEHKHLSKLPQLWGGLPKMKTSRETSVGAFAAPQHIIDSPIVLVSPKSLGYFDPQSSRFGVFTLTTEVIYNKNKRWVGCCVASYMVVLNDAQTGILSTAYHGLPLCFLQVHDLKFYTHLEYIETRKLTIVPDGTIWMTAG